MLGLGKFTLFLFDLVTHRESAKTYYKRTLEESAILGLGSLMIVILVALSLGGVMGYQTTYNFRQSPLSVDFVISTAIRSMVISEVGPTIVGLIFCGRIGSSIASQLASMKITEQVDALDVMGINSKSYLVLPKIIASVIMFPLLVILASIVAISTSYLICVNFLNITHDDFLYGMRVNFELYIVWVSIFKSAIFAFLISSISSYYGYNTYGGALEIGKTTTKAVSISSISVLIANYIIVKAFM